MRYKAVWFLIPQTVCQSTPNSVTANLKRRRSHSTPASHYLLSSPFGTPGSESFYQDVNTHDFIFAGNVRPVNEQDVLEFSIKADWERDWGTVTAWGFYSDSEDTFIADGTSGAFGFYGGTEACINSLDALTPSYTPAVPGGVTALPAPTFIFWFCTRGTGFTALQPYNL